ncbi:HNH endonuclease [Nostoc sp. CHAB 5836]|uniref:HNH endonuclease n=1 Tax=Nostoc sp. CHAB 5836 TaxID=2780404 RepID=UPI001E4C3801|nr:HNH endonuclease [Nostoc sp. CHAB 5836]MCC5618555.1 HNH endonuclease [Nostoc sp. CHAB 5836]
MSSPSEIIRQKVRQRAENRCEYCLSHQDYIMGRLQIDHIQPLAKGGVDTEDNLCLACELCNQYKWTQTEGLDSQSGKTVSLFNPRQQQWKAHFTWSTEGTEIVPITPCGRATVKALRLNNSLAVTVRKNWVQAGWHPPS